MNEREIEKEEERKKTRERRVRAGGQKDMKRERQSKRQRKEIKTHIGSARGEENFILYAQKFLFIVHDFIIISRNKLSVLSKLFGFSSFIQ